MTSVTVNIDIAALVNQAVPAQGIVTFTATAPVARTTSGILLGPGLYVQRSLDSAGTATAVLQATDDSTISPVGWSWYCVIRTDQLSISFYFLLPGTPSTVNLSDLLPSSFSLLPPPPSPPGTPPPVLSVAGKTGYVSLVEADIAGLVADLAGKATDANVMHLTGNETAAGTKTFSTAPIVPDGSFPESKVIGLTSDLALRAMDASVVHLLGAETITGAKTFTGVTTVPTPVNATDAATKAYADGSQVVNARAFNPKGDAVRLRGISLTNGSNILTATGTTPTAAFTSADVGKTVIIGDFNGFSRIMTTTITGFTDSSHVTMAANAPQNLSGAGAVAFYGTDDTAALNSFYSTAGALASPVDTGIGPNVPMGQSQVIAWLGHSPYGGGYIVTGQLAVPAAVIHDGPGLIINGQTDIYNPVVSFAQYSGYRNLRLESIFGTGVVVNSAGAGTQADDSGGNLVLWNIGTALETGGTGRSQDGLVLNGYGFPIATRVWMKGGRRGIYHNAGSDCIVAMAHLIGCKMPIWVNGGNMVRYGTVILDTCGDTVAGNSGITLDNGCSLCTFGDVAAFEVVGSTRTLDNVLLIGAGGSGNNTQIRANLVIQKTGGNGVNLVKAQDFTINVVVSNTASASSGGSNNTTAVVWTSGVAGSADVMLACNTSVTPYSGNPGGGFRWVRSGTVYQTQGGTAPTPTLQAGNGSSPPACTVTGNGQRGSASFGSGSSPAAGDQVVLTYNDSTGWVNAPKAVALSANQAAAALIPYRKVTATALTLGFVTAPAASQTAGTYVVDYSMDG